MALAQKPSKPKNTVTKPMPPHRVYWFRCSGGCGEDGEGGTAKKVEYQQCQPEPANGVPHLPQEWPKALAMPPGEDGRPSQEREQDKQQVDCESPPIS
jgi:hypothetical protein